MDGEETLCALREMRRDTRVILSSGYTEQEAVNRFSSLGYPVLSKTLPTAEIGGHDTWHIEKE